MIDSRGAARLRLEGVSVSVSTRETRPERSPSTDRPEFLRTHPQIFVTELERAAAFYRDRLGFSVEYLYGDPPHYGLVERGGAGLNLRHVDENPFDAEIRKRIPVSTNRAVLRWIGEAMHDFRPSEKTTFGQVMREVADTIPARGLVVILSDLFAPRDEIAAGLEQFTVRKHDVVVFHVLDESELTFPFEANMLFRGLEEYPEVTADSRSLRDAYLESIEGYLDQVERICSLLGVDYHRCHNGEPLDAAIVAVIASRARVRRR